MTDRIRELAAQTDQNTPYRIVIPTRDWLEEYTRLVIEDCCKLLKDHEFASFFGGQIRSTPEENVEVIKKYFGVK